MVSARVITSVGAVTHCHSICSAQLLCPTNSTNSLTWTCISYYFASFYFAHLSVTSLLHCRQAVVMSAADLAKVHSAFSALYRQSSISYQLETEDHHKLDGKGADVAASADAGGRSTAAPPHRSPPLSSIDSRGTNSSSGAVSGGEGGGARGGGTAAGPSLQEHLHTHLPGKISSPSGPGLLQAHNSSRRDPAGGGGSRASAIEHFFSRMREASSGGTAGLGRPNRFLDAHSAVPYGVTSSSGSFASAGGVGLAPPSSGTGGGGGDQQWSGQWAMTRQQSGVSIASIGRSASDNNRLIAMLDQFNSRGTTVAAGSGSGTSTVVTNTALSRHGGGEPSPCTAGPTTMSSISQYNSRGTVLTGEIAAAGSGAVAPATLSSFGQQFNSRGTMATGEMSSQNLVVLSGAQVRSAWDTTGMLNARGWRRDAYLE